jgi:TolB-like protein
MLGAPRDDIPRWVAPVLARATARNPADRFATAAEFRQALAEPPLEPRRRLAWMAAGATVLALVGTAVAFLPSRTAGADPRKIVVARFENRTGDSALAPVGDIATDYIARGLAATRLLHDVFDLRVSALEAGERAPPGPAAARELAKRVGAGTVLWGTYYVQEDSLRFEAQLVDAPTGKTLLSLEPAVGSLGEKTRAVEILRQRVMAGFATLVGANFESWATASVPPTYEAYREMLEGHEEALDFGWEQAAAHYQRAATLDSSYTGAYTARALVLSLDRKCEAVDSIARGLADRADLLPPIDRGQLDYATATCRNDGEAALAASRAVLLAEPRSVSFAVLGAVAALEQLHPRAALEVLRLHDPERARIKQPSLGMYLNWLTMTYHMLGDYRRQLETARSGLRAVPNTHEEAVALAALGRVADAERLAVGFLPERYDSEELWSPQMAECVALELRAHGHPEASRRVMERVAAWFDPGNETSSATADLLPCMWHLLSASYYLGQWDKARAAYQERLAQDSASLKAHAALGALAIRQGDHAEARRMDQWLRAHPESPRATLSRARLAALRGDREGAVRLLQQAFDQGLNGRMFLHIDPDFESLLDYPPYRELIRPKG